MELLNISQFDSDVLALICHLMDGALIFQVCIKSLMSCMNLQLGLERNQPQSHFSIQLCVCVFFNDYLELFGSQDNFPKTYIDSTYNLLWRQNIKLIPFYIKTIFKCFFF